MFVTVLAGCTGKASDATANIQRSAVAAEFDETTGGIEGVITDDETIPVAGAQVGIISLGLTTVTDVGGGFSLSKIEPGDHMLSVNALGYHALAQPVTVVAGEKVDLEIQLEAIAVKEAYAHPVVKRGLFGCGMSWRPAVVYSGVAACGVIGIVSELGGVDTSAYDNFLLQFDVAGSTEAGWSASAFEMKWDSNQAAGKGLNMIWEIDGCPNVAAARFSSVSGRSILKGDADAAKIATVVNGAKDVPSASCDAPAGEVCTVTACRIMSRVFSQPDTFGAASAADVGITSQQTFEQTHTAFYNQVQPQGYTAYL